MSEPRPRTPARRGTAPVETLVAPFAGSDLAAQDSRDRLSRSARAYVYIHALEEMLRAFIAERLFVAAANDPRWLITALDRIDPELAPLVAGRKTAAERKRGYLDLEESAPITYLTVAELKSLVLHHWDLFEPELQDKAQFSAVFDVIHVSRNAIAHNRGVGAELVEQLRSQTLHLMSRIDGAPAATRTGDLDPVEELFADRYGDLVRTFPTREAAGEFTRQILADGMAIDAMGIALTELAHMTSIRHLRARIDEGLTLRLLLCDPDVLSASADADLARASIARLQNLHADLGASSQTRVAIRVMATPPHISAYICDGAWVRLQVYPRGERIVEAPVLVARVRDADGLVAHAQREFLAAWDAARPLSG